MSTVYMISLGCAKNLVDSEIMLGSLEKRGWLLQEDPLSAEVLLINTCGFIQSAVEEAVEEILQLINIKREYPEKKIVVVGCLVQRYREQLLPELPEVDLFIGTEGAKDMGAYLNRLMAGEAVEKLQLPERYIMDSSLPRTITTPLFRSWLKITEGCDNRCSYCMIPTIRGNLRSRSIEDLVREAQFLEGRGVRELSLIAQDLTAFGDDREKQANLVSLLENLLGKTTIPWLRLLYLYPSGIDEALLSLMASAPRIVPYLDIPFQHVSNSILAAMNRRYTAEDLYRLIVRIRTYLPEVALRTTFLVGFPGETEQDIVQLEKFMRDARLDHVGIFSYANEEGCPSEHFPGQCTEEEKDERRGHLLAVQAEISAEIQKKYIGRLEQVLIEGYSSETDLLLEGRTRFQAPDVDGCVYIAEGEASPGEIALVNITEAHIYDLVGRIIDPEKTGVFSGQ
jgi:ribosomal protein S12 methylthiotransferase